MNTLGLQPVYRPHNPTGRIKGIILVIALHVLIAWAIVSGTARQTLEYIKKPLKAVVIQEVIIPPPPPPPPPKRIEPPKAIPKLELPPPPFIPPPDIPPPVITTAPVIQAVQAPPPKPFEIKPPPPPPPPPAPKPAPKPAGPTITSMGVACPTQVAPEMPRRAIRENMSGVVKAQARIKDGKVIEVSILSGPRLFHEAVKEAMEQYGCTKTAQEVLATQEFEFKID